MPGAANLHGDEAARARTRAAPRVGRHRLPPVFHPAAVQCWQHDHGLRAGNGRGRSSERSRRQTRHQCDGRRWLLAQRLDQRHRQRRLQSVGQPARPGIVHRLDSGTTGLMVIARSQRAYDSLVEALTDHEVGREYLALVWGHFDSPTAIVDAPIGRHPRDPMKMAVVNNGKWARTHLEVVQTFNVPADLSLVQCTLETGRTHQIRVHLASVQHPVVGDSMYGGAKSALVAKRPLLHAARLTLVHPGTGEEMTWEAPLPDDFVAILGKCELVVHE